eukprot:GHVR01083619.1.p1 GENE.GHVR01083619.1~~GHVR01083619.1.p1  ORF type:complete len:154 (-),score=11.15 GHVR01083619.1:552-1013(-)
MSPDIIKQLQNKHRQLPHRSTISHQHPLPELNITESHIRTVVNNLQGGYGPSGTDANHWKEALLLYFASHSDRLREAIAKLTNHRYGNHRYGNHRYGNHRYGNHRYGKAFARPWLPPKCKSRGATLSTPHTHLTAKFLVLRRHNDIRDKTWPT